MYALEPEDGEPVAISQSALEINTTLADLQKATNANVIPVPADIARDVLLRVVEFSTRRAETSGESEDFRPPWTQDYCGDGDDLLAVIVAADYFGNTALLHVALHDLATKHLAGKCPAEMQRAFP